MIAVLTEFPYSPLLLRISTSNLGLDLTLLLRICTDNRSARLNHFGLVFKKRILVFRHFKVIIIKGCYQSSIKSFYQ